MPYSHPELRDKIVEWVRVLQPHRIVDVGPGSGTYAKLLRPVVPEVELIGVEIFAPYIAQFHLDDLYDEIRIGDVRTVDWERLAPDLTVVGDCLEHMPVEDAVAVVWGALREGPVILSVPLGEYPQGPSRGNPFEEHVATWTHEEIVEMFAPDEFEIGRVVGVYLLG